VWYQIYGHFPDTIAISRSQYRCAGVPLGIEIVNQRRPGRDEIATGFLTRPLFTDSLKHDFPKLASIVESAPECTMLRGEVPDSPNLDYLRDIVGLVTWFFDNGAVAVLDAQTAVWYDGDKWRREIFEPGGMVPNRYAVVVSSEDKIGSNTNVFWLHTRGLRKFARPDLSWHAVPKLNREAAIGLCCQLIETQALGAVIADGQRLMLRSLTNAVTCHNAGSLDDAEFNNMHVEIGWAQ